MANPLTMKLEQFASFDPEERQRLDQLLTYPTKTYERGRTIIRERDKVDDVHLVLAEPMIAPFEEHQAKRMLVVVERCRHAQCHPRMYAPIPAAVQQQ